uniref:Uncharacterized protein n=1 Tax=Glossina palpalis gambiensis TaxID=67801 RepID=A0A1B0AR92_9MUSC
MINCCENSKNQYVLKVPENSKKRLYNLTSKLINNDKKLLEYDSEIQHLVREGLAERLMTNPYDGLDGFSSEIGFISLNDHLSPVDNVVANLLISLLRFRSVFMPTNRNIVIAMAKLCNSMGFLDHFTTKTNIANHMEEADWDQPLISEVPNELSILSEIGKLIKDVNIFADASSIAFQAMAYIRHIIRDGQITTNLICSKNRASLMEQESNEVILTKLELMPEFHANLHLASNSKICHCNIQSIKPVVYSVKFDIIAITETWLKLEVPDVAVDIRLTSPDTGFQLVEMIVLKIISIGSYYGECEIVFIGVNRSEMAALAVVIYLLRGRVFESMVGDIFERYDNIIVVIKNGLYD